MGNWHRNIGGKKYEISPFLRWIERDGTRFLQQKWYQLNDIKTPCKSFWFDVEYFAPRLPLKSTPVEVSDERHLEEASE